MQQRSLNEPRLNDHDQRNLIEIFKLEARQYENNRIDGPGLDRIFSTVGFEPNKNQKKVFQEVLDANGGTMNQHMFLQVFNLKQNQNFKEVDVRNAFRLLSKEYERPGMIRLERVKEFFQEMGLTDMEIVQLTS